MYGSKRLYCTLHFETFLKVDGIEMTGKTQEQAVTILRRTTGLVKLQIQRKVAVTSPIGSTKLVRFHNMVCRKYMTIPRK